MRGTRRTRHAAAGAGIGALALLAGCAGVPFNAPRVESHAVAPARDSTMGRAAAPWFDRADGASGFVPLGDGEAALGARLRLIDEAERSIDAQYFLMKPDFAAALVSDALMRAAERGVRVRLLLDDVFTTAPDADLAILDARPNIEVRVFNPVPRPGPKALGAVAGLPGSNRRMHNKAFVADSSVAIVGGRNIADEYYAIEQEIEFADFDMLAAGPVAVEVSNSFDAYWNSRRSVPLAALVPASARERASEHRIGERASSADLARAERIYDDAVSSTLIADLRSGRLGPVTAAATVVADPPAKLGHPVGSGLDPVFRAMRGRMATAREEVILISPYFVPGREGTAFFRDLRARGVEVVVVTNSLASTNHAYVHGGYFPYRNELLDAGVTIYEAKADAAVSSVTGAPTGLTLHTKGMIVDRSTIFIGSPNFDPRSFELNTEMGIMIESPALARQFAAAVETDVPLYAWSVGLDAQGRTVWRHGEGPDAETRTSEPGASVLHRLIAGLAALLPVESQL